MGKKEPGKYAALIGRVSRPTREYPWMDTLMMGYITIVLVFQVLFQISPAVTFLATTPLYSIQTYLGLLGGGLIVLDLFTTKRLWQGPYSILLYGIGVMAALASVRTIGYGMKENLFKLCWAAIQFAICYSCAHRMEREKLKKFFVGLYGVLLAIWFVACCVSLWQYAEQIGYWTVVNPLAKDSSATRQGFYDNRLFGIFYTLNHAAFVSTLFFDIGLLLAIHTRKLWVRIVLGMTNLVLLCHIILSGSRSASIALVCSMLCLAWFLARNRVVRDGWRGLAIPVACAVAAAVLSAGIYSGMKSVLVYVPYAHEQIFGTNSSGDTSPDATVSPDDQTEPESKPDKDLLDRPNLEEDVSNGRLSIWKDYISLFWEIGPIGLSPGNYMGHVFENHPELYIVDYIKEHYPDKYESGIIYHVHSGYIMVYVSAGWIGALLLAAFIALCVMRLVRRLHSREKTSALMTCTFLLALVVSISAVFDEGIFFQNNPQTTIFWIALGILMKECHSTAAEKIARID